MRHKLFLLIVLVFGWNYLLLSQSILVAIGPISQYTKPINPIVKGTNVTKYNSDIVHAITYEHFLPKSQISLLTSFSRYEGNTAIGFDIGGASNGNGQILSSTGFTGVKVNIFNIGAGYNLLKKVKKIYLRPTLSFGIQVSNPNGYKVLNDFLISGPDYVEIDISSESKETVQIVPSFGFKTGIVLWKRIDIGLNFYGVLGHKYYQKLIFKYEYKGVPQADGIFGSNGTGYGYSLGIGYRFAKFIR